MKYLYLLLLASSVDSLFWPDLYRTLASENAKSNLIYSPVSIEFMMGLVYMAAGGKTAQEIRNVFKLPENKSHVVNSYRQFFTGLRGREKVLILHMANRIYVNRKYRLEPEFNKLVVKAFKGSARSIRLNDPVRACLIINSWILNRTRGMIGHIVSPSDLHPDTSAFLLSAIYFKAQWQYNFPADQTHAADFHVSADKVILVEMMTLSATLSSAYLEDLDAKVIELPYLNSTLSMRIYLPNGIEGLTKVEEKAGLLSHKLQKNSVNVKLPKFKIESSAQLRGIFEKKGIRDVFKPSADLNGLVLDSGARIDKIVQKAFLKVDERGTKASAATGVLIRRKKSIDNLQLPPMDFVADHPFSYVIHDHDAIYFQGHIVEPRW
ncbi:serine protease inhibitor 42Dd [Drosophila teissieri]|uniref:serine protease inhibitor 42Dd n=1 Tax=Drosophila teissieri TaxID=7243 RepID=UPI001CBA0E6C|nr:serine protease inhibitor 42Dd [Drosophila teissieri]